jgi:hypothetical protein
MGGGPAADCPGSGGGLAGLPAADRRRRQLGKWGNGGATVGMITFNQW